MSGESFSKPEFMNQEIAGIWDMLRNADRSNGLIDSYVSSHGHLAWNETVYVQIGRPVQEDITAGAQTGQLKSKVGVPINRKDLVEGYAEIAQFMMETMIAAGENATDMKVVLEDMSKFEGYADESGKAFIRGAFAAYVLVKAVENFETVTLEPASIEQGAQEGFDYKINVSGNNRLIDVKSVSTYQAYKDLLVRKGFNPFNPNGDLLNLGAEGGSRLHHEKGIPVDLFVVGIPVNLHTKKTDLTSIFDLETGAVRSDVLAQTREAILSGFED